MDGRRFDSLAKTLADVGTRRMVLAASLAAAIGVLDPVSLVPANKKNKKPQKITICFQGQTQKTKKKGVQTRFPGATVGACTTSSLTPTPTPTPTIPPPSCARANQCGAGCCDPSRCFAETVSDVDRRPLSFGCCPAPLLCLSTTPSVPDQCCYPDETCDPTLPSRLPAGQEPTLCCRSCGGGCCESFEACRDGVCTPLPTARLPRTRRA